MALEYSLPTSFGTFTSRTEATYLDSFRLQQSAVAPFRELVTRRHRHLAMKVTSSAEAARLNWSWNSFDVTGTVPLLRMASVSRY